MLVLCGQMQMQMQMRVFCAGNAGYPSRRPRVCPHCGEVGTMSVLPLLFDVVLCVVTMSLGAVDGMRLPNWYCTSPSCCRALFDVASCIPFGGRLVPAGVKGPALALQECMAAALASSELWPMSPVKPELVFEYEVLNWLRSIQFRCVSCSQHSARRVGDVVVDVVLLAAQFPWVESNGVY